MVYLVIGAEVNRVTVKIPNRLFKNKHQAVSQGARRFGKRSIVILCEHLQKPCNAGSRREALFFNSLPNRKFVKRRPADERKA
jgi:hypothetical protein